MSDELELNETKVKEIKKIIDKYLTNNGLTNKGAIFAKYLDDSLECYGYEAVYVASLYPNKYKLYYTKKGWDAKNDYIIVTPTYLSIERIYDDLMGEDEVVRDDYPFKEFINDVYEIDDDFEPKSKVYDL